jgi:hypothetical protein
MSHSELAIQNQYKDVNMRIPRYRYARIPLNNLTSGTVAFQPTSSTLLEWKIPASSVVNLSKSYIAYNYAWPALASNYGFTYEDGCDYRTAYFGNGSGLGVVDLQYADVAANVLRPIKTPINEFLCKDQLSQFYPCNQLATSNLLPFSRDGLLTGTENASTNNYLEPQHLYISPTINTAINIYRYFPLNSFKNTLFDCDKDLVFGTDMYLRLYTQYLQRMGGYTTTPNNPNVAANFTNISANVNASNVYLYLAIEENLDVRNSLLTALAHGSIKMSIPYLYNYRFSVAGQSAAANVSLTLTKNYGRNVKSIHVVPFNANEFSQYAFDHSNINGTKVSQIQSTMDGRPLTDYMLNCVNPYSTVYPTGVPWTSSATIPSNFADDYREALKFTNGSVLNGYPAFQTHWFYCDAWGVPTIADLNKYTNSEYTIVDGFDLVHSGDHIYAIQALTPALGTNTNNCYTSGLINYIMVTFTRTLEIQPDGIILSA